jgi:hypothetical protein
MDTRQLTGSEVSTGRASRARGCFVAKWWEKCQRRNRYFESRGASSCVRRSRDLCSSASEVFYEQIISRRRWYRHRGPGATDRSRPRVRERRDNEHADVRSKHFQMFAARRECRKNRRLALATRVRAALGLSSSSLTMMRTIDVSGVPVDLVRASSDGGLSSAREAAGRGRRVVN